MYRGTAKERPATAEELFHKLFSNVSRLSELIGMNGLDPDFGLNRRMIWTWAALLVAIANVAFYLWKQRSDMVELVMVVPYACFVIQALHMMIKVLANHPNYKLLHAKSKQIFDMLNETSTSRKLMAESLQFGIVLQGFLAVMYTMAFIFIISMPLFIWCISGEKILLLMYRLPAVDDNTTHGFLETLALHVALLLVSLCGFVGIDCFFLALIIPIIAFNNQLTAHLYDIKWYLLPAGQAKHLVLMLERAQNAPTLTVGKFATFNMQFYDRIMRKIYSFVMLLATFLESA
ncbi:hypothetical protein pipiens_006984 [Culex pipiens pipiens]|uniref:Odorant receptor n=1 Tax=Culex pipiens pipiens TaxID=38569 RepID=A0ABD1DN67_CULPP